MKAKTQFAVDRETGRIRQLSNEPLLSSASGPWKGMLLQAHGDQRALEGKLILPVHTVVQQLSPADFEERVDGGAFLRPLPGQVRVLPAEVPIDVRGRSNGELLVLTLDPQRVRLLAGEAFPEHRINLTVREGVEDATVNSLLNALTAEVEAGFSGGRLYADSLGQSLVLRLLVGQGTRLKAEQAYRGKLGAAAVTKVIEYIEENLAGTLSLVELAQVVDLSPFHFARAFKRSTGLSPHAFVVQRRVERARALLSSGASIAETSLAVGFADQSHLTLHFRRVFGVTPGKYVRPNGRR